MCMRVCVENNKAEREIAFAISILNYEKLCIEIKRQRIIFLVQYIGLLYMAFC